MRKRGVDWLRGSIFSFQGLKAQTTREGEDHPESAQRRLQEEKLCFRGTSLNSF